jgi:predicted nucleic acid-binding protein
VVLVDTSVWIRFLAGREPYARGLDSLLERGEVVAHDLIEGELLIGDRGGRPEVLAAYAKLPRIPAIAHDEALELVRSRKLHGRGVGWIDVHLIASALVAGADLWTADEPLAEIAVELDAAYMVSRR